MARKINAGKITEAVKHLAISANFELSKQMVSALQSSLKRESSPAGKEALKDLIKNAGIAKKEKLPICQDTGYAMVFVEVGQEVLIVGGNINDAINKGVREGYKKGYLRKSIVADPFGRKNTGDNTPAGIVTEIVPGSKVKMTFMAKGCGSENTSALKMFLPTAPWSNIVRFVTDRVMEVGATPCPPVIVGLGIGGTADKAMLLAKKALLRNIGKHNKSKDIAKKEKELLAAVNKTGVGPEGLGGRVTAIAANIETFPPHIAGLPVALAIDCCAHRVKAVTI